MQRTTLDADARQLLALARTCRARAVSAAGDAARVLRAQGLDLVDAGADFVVIDDGQLDRAGAARPGGSVVIRTLHGAPPEQVLEAALRLETLTLVGRVGSGFHLRRLDPPGYRLAPNLRVQGRVLACDAPVVALLVSAAGARVVEVLHGEEEPLRLLALAKKAGVPIATTFEFIDDLVKRGYVERLDSERDRYLPAVSCIVPALNRHEETRACVEALFEQSYPAVRREVVVVDDGSQPPLEEALRGLPVRLVRLEHPHGPSAARNEGAKVADNDVLAFLDNDCRPQPDWLGTLTTTLDEPNVDIVAGRNRSAVVYGTMLEKYESVRSPLDLGPDGGAVTPGTSLAYLPSANLLVRREAFEGVGGFDASLRLGEDVDFVWKALTARRGARYTPEAEVLHGVRESLSAMLQRRLEYASSEGALTRRHPKYARRALHIPVFTTLVASGLAALPFSWVLAVALLVIAAGAFGLEAWEKAFRMLNLGAVPRWGAFFAGLLRAHRASWYHLSVHAGRYYGLLLVLLGLIHPAFLLFAGLLLPVAPITDWWRLNAPLDPVSFLALTILEMVAYQFGVLFGALRHATPLPLFPRIVFRR